MAPLWTTTVSKRGVLEKGWATGKMDISQPVGSNIHPFLFPFSCVDVSKSHMTNYGQRYCSQPRLASTLTLVHIRTGLFHHRLKLEDTWAFGLLLDWQAILSKWSAFLWDGSDAESTVFIGSGNSILGYPGFNLSLPLLWTLNLSSSYTSGKQVFEGQEEIFIQNTGCGNCKC